MIIIYIWYIFNLFVEWVNEQMDDDHVLNCVVNINYLF